ncbi:MAG: glycosyltransferase family 2 protein [Oculatellaceae cyanobacterium bins.114]|nr:glycosyltransferase family 2 protein [Oculatellaceae cyanobacterium bins.114]
MPLITKALTLNDLPVPSSDKDGFPWTEHSNVLDDRALNRFNYPCISIVTPSYNQGQFIEETIRSVLLQGYPNLEYIIIDGGSTDNTIEIIRKYEPWITHWVSERDRGQAHAINKGLARSTGDILAYLNSDDYYLPNALFSVAAHFKQNPQTDLLHGRCRYIDVLGNKIGEQFGNIHRFSEIIDLWNVWWAQRQFVQPEVFWTKRITEQIGYFREDLNYVMDYDYWCRILKAGGAVNQLDSEMACFRFTSQQKSNQREQVAQELLEVVRPLLWSSDVRLPLKQRLILQGKYLYQTVFLKQVEKSLTEGDRPLIRITQMIAVALSNPQILLIPEFQKRTMNYLSGSVKH